MTAKQLQEIDARRSVLQSETQRFVADLARDRDTVGIVLFGSLVDGTLNECSDIDLMVVRETEAPFLDRLRSVRRQLRPQVATDFLVYTRDEVRRLWRDRPFFREEVMNRGRVLYERERGTLAPLQGAFCFAFCLEPSDSRRAMTFDPVGVGSSAPRRGATS